MKATKTALAGVLVIEPSVYQDARGFFLESYNQKVFAGLGIPDNFVQDNHSFSERNVLRGLHFQMPHPQGKLIRVIEGEILDVAVDLRKTSSTLGKWHGEHLSGSNQRMLWVPAGLAHGFRVVSATAHVLYKATDFYHPECERTLAWNDAEIGIDWELDEEPVVSTKDSRGQAFRELQLFE
ncbi:MAG: dTDP-4-dehydrorhamnose 3,5-epimerase [Acidobacteriales bacterium]|nr:dTDP-4-dehydrorhamnose 3,5-epimerase [Terriglobales bacterium]